MDGRDRVRPDARLLDLPLRLLHRARARSSSAWRCWSGSGSSASRRTSRAYERQLAKQRYYSRQRFAHPETTIRRSPRAGAAAAGAGRTRADRRPAVRGRPPAPGRPPRHDRDRGPGHRERPERRHRRAGVRAAGTDRPPHEPQLDVVRRDRGRRLGGRRRRADAGPGRRGGRLAARRPPRAPGPTGRRCARSSSSSPGPCWRCRRAHRRSGGDPGPDARPPGPDGDPRRGVTRGAARPAGPTAGDPDADEGEPL